MTVIVPGISKVDFTTKNTAIVIVMQFTVLFMFAAVGLAMLSTQFPALAAFSVDLWKMFGTSYGALFIALNVTHINNPPPVPPAPPVPPTEG